ncbi:hypothetical protein F2Q68_00043058 [Brassica cretica]|uniref:Copine C-terminal domain-containing protein n=1 Tax=Brassica cretica TaxID=69181 RepID=A0A8S9LMH5_BRACR|nr:hypothetical protein F2Q68_00043058 [Brassica cretica]
MKVTRGVDKAEGELSQQEIYVNANSYALSIVLIGVADGRWEDMRKFDDKIPKREFDNFQVSSHSLKTTGVAKKINLRPPPTPYTPTIRTELPSPAPDEHTQVLKLAYSFTLYSRTRGATTTFDFLTWHPMWMA